MAREPVADDDEIEVWDPDHEQEDGEEQASRGITKVKRRTAGIRAAKTMTSAVSAGKSQGVQNLLA